MLSKLTFISLLTEGINTVVPFFDDEISACCDVINDYLSDNFNTLAAELGEDEFEDEVYPAIIIKNVETKDNAFTLSFNGPRIYMLKDGDILNPDIAGSMYGILTLLCTFLVARLNNFSFSSNEIDPSMMTAAFGEPTHKDSDEAEEDEILEEESSESSFDDEWL